MLDSDNEGADKGLDSEDEFDGNHESTEQGFDLGDFDVPNRENVDDKKVQTNNDMFPEDERNQPDPKYWNNLDQFVEVQTDDGLNEDFEDCRANLERS